MLQGRVDDGGMVVVDLEVAGRVWRAVIDTGFNGDLELPPSLGAALPARYVGKSRFALAGGQTVVQETYRVRIPFDGEELAADANFVEGSEILIGTRLLRSHRLEINFADRTVVLERV